MGGGRGGDFRQGHFNFDGSLLDVLDPTFMVMVATNDDDGDNKML